ncbi:MAG: hypothetical protein ABIG64_09445 [Candidatus Omnitrophota bacterium]
MNKIIIKTTVLILIQALLIPNIAWAQDVSTLSPSISVSNLALKSSFIAVNSGISGSGALETVFNEKNNLEIIKSVLAQKVFKRIGNGASTIVLGDKEKELVLKIPLLGNTRLRKEDEDFIYNSFFINLLNNLIKKYSRKRFMIEVKIFLKKLYFAIKGIKTGPEDLNSIYRGYELAEKYKFKNTLRAKVIPNITGQLNIKGLDRFKLKHKLISKIIITEQINPEDVLFEKIRTEIKNNHIEKAFLMCEQAVKTQVNLWHEGGYDLDESINILENMAILPSGKYKLIDLSSLTVDKDIAREFIKQKRKEIKTVLNLLKTNSIDNTLELIKLSAEIQFSKLYLVKNMISDSNLARKFAIHFMEVMDKYFTLENLEEPSQQIVSILTSNSEENSPADPNGSKIIFKFPRSNEFAPDIINRKQKIKNPKKEKNGSELLKLKKERVSRIRIIEQAI